jgi:protease II
MKTPSPLVLLFVPAVLAAQSRARLEYPKTRQAEQVGDYFGTKVRDPYRWLEDDLSAETKAWVAAQNRVSFAYLGAIEEREAIRTRLTALWDHERHGLPTKESAFYVYAYQPPGPPELERWEYGIDRDGQTIAEAADAVREAIELGQR